LSSTVLPTIADVRLIAGAHIRRTRAGGVTMTFVLIHRITM
jgi:hypothetical protein